MELVFPDFLHELIDTTYSLDIVGIDTPTPFVVLDSALVFQAQFVTIRGHDVFRQWLSENHARVEHLPRPLPPPPSSPSHAATTTTTTTAATDGLASVTLGVTPKKRSRVANPGDAFPVAVQEAHQRQELSVREAATAAAASAAATMTKRAPRRPTVHGSDDDVDDKVLPPKRSRVDDDGLPVDDIDDDDNDGNDNVDDNGDDNDDDDDDDEDDDDDDDDEIAAPLNYLGLQIAEPSTVRIYCYPSSLQLLRERHPNA